MMPRLGWRRSIVGGLASLGFALWSWSFLLPSALGDPPGKAPAKAKDNTKAKEAPTFTKDVAPILQKKCQNCHRKHQVGPFALESYDQARKRATDIAMVVSDRSMPPWKPERGVGPKLKHDQSLSPEEIAILEAWAEAGAPKGDPKHMPKPAEFAVGWKLGEPDLVLEASEDFLFAAGAADTYRCFVLPTNLARDTYISAIDFQPRNPRIVHHINAFIDCSGDARERDEAEPGIGYTSFLQGRGSRGAEDPEFLGHGRGKALSSLRVSASGSLVNRM